MEMSLQAADKPVAYGIIADRRIRRGRPEGGKLWAELARGDVLVVSKLDRVFRSASGCLNVVQTLKDRGVSLFLLDLNGGADDVSGNGIARLFLTIVAAFAEFERDRIGERIRATKRAQKARGEYLGGKAPFGFTYDASRNLVPIPEQQRAIRDRGTTANAEPPRQSKPSTTKRDHSVVARSTPRARS
jgi:DNA invertase Pin-like site-specific DNA recombinase